MNRRTMLNLAASTLAAASLLPRALAQTPNPSASNGNFEAQLDATVRDLVSKPYLAPERRLDDALANVSYDQYRENIIFKPENAIWREDSLNFRIELFQAAGAFYSFPVDIFTVQNGEATQVAYSPQLFSFTSPLRPPAPQSRSGFAGFRVRTPIGGDPTLFDEFLTFLGASYFRSIGAGQTFGIGSARGLAISTGQSGGEEFPLFRSFWIEKPNPGDKRLVIHALLDSASAVGRYKFVVIPGASTVIEVETTIYPRKRIPYLGISPVTGMFFFAPHAQAKRKDYRPRAHDVDGLSMLTGSGEWIWRPIINPERLQFSVFVDRNPKGFGLIQRPRNFSEYQDMVAAYERRPTVWVEPIGEWGEGSIDLVELPAQDDVHDNAVCFWRPKDGLSPSPNGYRYQYRLSWTRDIPVKTSKPLARVLQTRLGETRTGEAQFIVDFESDDQTCEPCDTAALTTNVTMSAGEVRNVALKPVARPGSYRLSFQYIPSGSQSADLRAVISLDNAPVSETWVFRWTR